MTRTIAVCASAGADQRTTPPSARAKTRARRANLIARRDGAGHAAAGTARGSGWARNCDPRGIHGRAAFVRRRPIRLTKFDMFNRFLRSAGYICGHYEFQVAVPVGSPKGQPGVREFVLRCVCLNRGNSPSGGCQPQDGVVRNTVQERAFRVLSLAWTLPLDRSSPSQHPHLFHPARSSRSERIGSFLFGNLEHPIIYVRL